MDILIETPKYSFIKYHKYGDDYKVVFFSPIPTLFNYGFIMNTIGEDGMEQDAIVMGPKLSRGTVIHREKVNGVVRFIDDGLQDDKYLFCDGKLFSKTLFGLYFHIYALFKWFRYLIFERRRATCRFEGFDFF